MKEMTMYQNEIKEIAKQPTFLASLAGFLNPATIVPALAIGAVCAIAYRVHKSHEAGETDQPKADPISISKIPENNRIEPCANRTPTVRETVENSAFQPLKAESRNRFCDQPQPASRISAEEVKKEVIRQAMSELGKRSAAAKRANK